MKVILPDKVYDLLLMIAQYIIPAVGTFFGALVTIWNIPYGEQILASLMALDTALGVLLGVSLKNWRADKTIPEPAIPSEEEMSKEVE